MLLCEIDLHEPLLSLHQALLLERDLYLVTHLLPDILFGFAFWCLILKRAQGARRYGGRVVCADLAGKALHVADRPIRPLLFARSNPGRVGAAILQRHANSSPLVLGVVEYTSQEAIASERLSRITATLDESGHTCVLLEVFRYAFVVAVHADSLEIRVLRGNHHGEYLDTGGLQQSVQRLARHLACRRFFFQVHARALLQLLHQHTLVDALPLGAEIRLDVLAECVLRQILDLPTEFQLLHRLIG
mmetsp:Transcript_21972/g.61451  ORF Transcript_21972/g.61451 Transcript_21972/m.61451 type:complete len:246 (-) Transcript_21972:123-860(-)